MHSDLKESLFLALKSKYESEINRARATLLIYFNNSVGIGEHPQHLEEMDKLVELMVSNKDKLKCLTDEFNCSE